KKRFSLRLFLCLCVSASKKSPPSLNLHVQLRRLRSHLGRATDHLGQRPALQLAQGPALHDPHHIGQLGRSCLVVSVKLLPLADDSLVERMRYAAAHFHHDGLGHLGRDHLADFLVLVTGFRHVISALLPVPSPGEWCRSARDPCAWPGPSSSLPSVPSTSENGD